MEGSTLAQMNRSPYHVQNAWLARDLLPETELLPVLSDLSCHPTTPRGCTAQLLLRLVDSVVVELLRSVVEFDSCSIERFSNVPRDDIELRELYRKYIKQWLVALEW